MSYRGQAMAEKDGGVQQRAGSECSRERSSECSRESAAASVEGEMEPVKQQHLLG